MPPNKGDAADRELHLHGQGKEWDELLLSASQPGFNVLDDCLTATLTDLGIAGFVCSVSKSIRT